MRNEDNCFDLIRHFAAVLVLCSHHFALSGFSEPLFMRVDTYGFVAVVIFFAISGYFMPTSFSHSGHFLLYMKRRCLRIFPGLFVCSFIIVFVIGLLFNEHSPGSYLIQSRPYKNLLLYSLFQPRAIDGVFSDFIFKDALDGSLWTLPVEFACYIILGLALTYAHSKKTLLTLFIAAVLMTILILNKQLNDFSFYSIPLSFLSRFGIAFTLGGLMGQTKAVWFPFRAPLVIASLLFIGVSHSIGPTEGVVFTIISLTLLTIIIATSFKDRWINRKFDFSYGIYIYAFPIQQIVINKITNHFLSSLIISFILTWIAGYFSYYYVESRFLHKKTSMKHDIENSHLLPIAGA